jgi:shikimate dehydrogenase
VAGVIGDPIHHSLSPALHNAAFAALGLDWVYVAFPVPAGQGASAVAAMRALHLSGLSVTMPHKADVVGSLDRLAPTAARLGVVNTIAWAAGGDGLQLEGESTDGGGFIDSIRGDDGFDPKGRRCLVLGSGGAARSVTLALAQAGAHSVAVAARQVEACVSCAGLAGAAGSTLTVAGAGTAGSTLPVAGAGRAGSALPVAEIAGAASDADLIVNATPVGMAAGDGLPFDLDPQCLRAGQLVVDLIYAPATTPLLAAARARGAATANGLGMLIHQAARQVAIWTGRPAPLEAMSAAALAALTSTAHRPD